MDDWTWLDDGHETAAHDTGGVEEAPALPAAPCDGCALYGRCKADLIACRDYADFVTGPSLKYPERGVVFGDEDERKPDKATYDAVYVEQHPLLERFHAYHEAGHVREAAGHLWAYREGLTLREWRRGLDDLGVSEARADEYLAIGGHLDRSPCATRDDGALLAEALEMQVLYRLAELRSKMRYLRKRAQKAEDVIRAHSHKKQVERAVKRANRARADLRVMHREVAAMLR